MNFTTIIYQQQASFALIRFNRPQRLNAVIEQLYRELLVALEQAEQDPQVRALLLCGAGRAFCVGADMKQHASGERSALQRRAYLQLGNDVCARLAQSKLPVVAAIHGYALGAGAEMACCCDFVFMAEDALIGFPEISIGTCVGGGVSQLLPALVGLNKARELIFSGDKINGLAAERIGLVYKAVPEPELLSRAEDFINTTLCRKAPISMGLAKHLLNTGGQRSWQDQLALELDAICTCAASADWQEGVQAFSAKRPPNFRGA